MPTIKKILELSRWESVPVGLVYRPISRVMLGRSASYHVQCRRAAVLQRLHQQRYPTAELTVKK